jgi:hypothetical protein
MRNIILSGFGALALALMTTAPSFASTYTDDADISEWAKPSVEILTEAGVLSGYSDGNFNPYWSINREEFAVALLQGLTVLDQEIRAAYEANDYMLADELTVQQIQLLEALTAIDELKAINAVEKNNYFAIGLGYNVTDGNKDDNSSIQLLGKVQVVKLSDKFAISVRPFVTTDATAGATATVDFDLSKKITAYTGVGAVANWSGAGELTGTSDVVGVANAGVEYHLSKDTVTGIDVKVPVGGSNSGDVVTTGFIGISF